MQGLKIVVVRHSRAGGNDGTRSLKPGDTPGGHCFFADAVTTGTTAVPTEFGGGAASVGLDYTRVFTEQGRTS
jgi:hypothetical protein